MLIFIIIGLVLVVSTLVTLYLTGVFKSKSSSIPTNNNTIVTTKSGSGGNSPVNENFITGAWVNKDGSQDLWTTNFIKNKMDMILLSSYCPNPYSTLYPCTSNHSLFPNDNTVLINIVKQARQFGKYVLFSIGGSSFGGEWGGLFHDSTLIPCQCPPNSYEFSCPAPPPQGNATTAAPPVCCESGTEGSSCGGIIELNDKDVGNCCSYANNPHRCCCGNGNKIVTSNGKQFCVPINPTSCNIPGILSTDITDLNICLNTAAKDPNDPNNAILQCKYQYSSSVLAYADMLQATGADGIDFDFEIETTDGAYSQYLIDFAKGLKNEMKSRNLPLILNLTVLSGDSYGNAGDPKNSAGNVNSLYGPLYDVLLTNTSPFDYVVPMLYNGGQYIYANPVPTDVPGNFYWNGLLNTWANKYLSKNSNTKLLPAFIEYDESAKHTGINIENAFQCSDLIHYINEYVNEPAVGAVSAVGVLYFWYTEDTSYNVNTLNANIEKTIAYFKNGTSITC